MRLSLLLSLALLTALGACSEFPELDEAVDSQARKAPYPDLVPVETITANRPETRIEPDTDETVEARAERLRSRARRLNRPVVDDATHERMDAGVN